MSAGVSLETQHKAEQFLYRQAEILDDRIWDDWLALFTADGHYWMPATPEQTEGEGQPNIFYEDHYNDILILERLALPAGERQHLVVFPE